MLDTGIYQIRNTATGKLYVGSAVSLRRRWCEHASLLRRGQHHSRHLQRAWNKRGPQAFVFEPLFICTKDMLLFYEQRAIDGLRPAYNGSPTAGNCLGVKHTDATRAKMRAANLGKKLSPEHAAAVSTARTGRKNTPEHNARIRAAALGRPVSEATKEKLRAANLGKKASSETRAKISAGNTGKACGPQGPLSEAHKAAISTALKGTVRSAETRAKMSAARKARARAGGNA